MRDDENTIILLAQESQNIDTVCLRGTAPLASLTRISRADVFDQVTRPNGIQRGLSMKHAAEAYAYVTRDADQKIPRAFPEVMLNVREKSVVSIEPVGSIEGMNMVKITVDVTAIDSSKAVKISRVDGNHRLYYGDGDGRDREPTDVSVPFSIFLGLSRDQEAGLFSDVNANQKGMNTSHLAILRDRLTREEVELMRAPWRVYARRLVEDEASPWKGLVHLGGSKAGAKAKGIKFPVTFIALESATRRMIRQSTALQELGDTDAKYGLIRNYWQAVAATWPDAFANPEDYLLVKSTGVNSLAQFASKVIDRCYTTGKVSVKAMRDMLKPVKDTINWAKGVDAHEGGVHGLHGNSAVLAISGQLTASLPALERPVDIEASAAKLAEADRKRADELLAQE